MSELPTFARDFEAAVVFYNPASTMGGVAYRQVKRQLDRVEGLMPIRYIETSPDAEESEATFAATVDPSIPTLAATVGGEGTDSPYAQILDAYDLAALMSLGPGNGGNLFRSLINKPDRTSAHTILQTGRVIDFLPMDCTFQLPDGQTFTRKATTIIGGHVTREMIFPINHESHRSSSIRDWHLGRYSVGKYIVDPPEMLAGFVRARKFEVQEILETPNEIYDAPVITSDLERVYINVPYVAGIVHAPEVSVTGPIHKAEAVSHLEIIRAIWLLRQGKSPGHDLTGPETFKTRGEVALQIDGEDSLEDNRLPLPAIEDNDGKKRKLLVLPEDTLVTIDQATKPIHVVTTMPHL